MNDLFSIEGKTAVITGGSRGIGFMIARGFLQAGARVYISARKAEACDAAAGELSAFGECISVPADVSTLSGIEHLVDAVAQRESGLHILVNNAGAAWGAPIDEFPEEGFDKVWQLNVKGLFFCTQRFLPLLRKAASREDPARVINIGSIDGIRVPVLDNFPYSAAKAGVHMLSRHLAQKLVGDNITVNAIAPGLFESKMTAFMFSDEELKSTIIDNIPLGRDGRADDITGTAIWLSSRAGSYLTGAVIPVDGGVSTR